MISVIINYQEFDERPGFLNRLLLQGKAVKLKKEDLLLERLKSYTQSLAYPFHMPGHKRRKNNFCQEFINPYEIDITEIEGFDNLHHPEGILQDSMQWASEIYGSDRTYYLINGSSSGILSAISSVCGFNDKIIVSRNCHKSVYHGIILKKLKAVYSYPQILKKMWITGGISVNDVEKILEKNPDACAVLVVSPTYDGIVSDIRGIAEAVHKRGIPLIVDEAHGAHFSFEREKEGRLFPLSSLDCGADIVIQSLHKTLPSFTQTAVLHVREGYIDLEKLEWYLQVYQSSSPSYILMAGIEHCIFEMEQKGKAYYSEFRKMILKTRKNLAAMEYLELLDEDVIGHCGIYGLDKSKIVVSCRNTGYSGEALGKLLREKYNLEMEMCGADYVVAITTVFDTQEGLDRLEKAFLEIDRDVFKNQLIRGTVQEEWEGCCPQICMTLSEAMEGNKERVLIFGCAGRISAEFIYLYPPGIPIVVPGERIEKEAVERVLWYRKMGFLVQGMADKKAEYLFVCRE